MIERQQGFTLIEALVSVAILAIGFAGVYSLVGVSNRVLHNSISKEQLNLQANEIIETLHSDPANITEYHGKDIGNCETLSVSADKAEQLKRLQRWCERVKGETGNPKSGDRRTIQVVKRTVDGDAANVVSVDLRSEDGTNTISVKRVFRAN